MEKQRKNRALRINEELRKIFPETKTVLNHKNNWELLVSVILSAQCTDDRVNKVTKELFKKYKKLDDYVFAKRNEFEKDIKPTGFYKNKAKNILASAKIISESFKNKVPKTMEELTTLPGVGRKTANVILGHSFGVTEGIAVDTHVRRFAIRFNLSDSKNPEKIEEDLMKLIPKKDWHKFSSGLVKYGQQICPARKHDCKNHPLTKIYSKSNTIWPKAK